jgi:hypothetical protein
MAIDLDFKPLPGNWRNGNDFDHVQVLKITGPPGVKALLYTCHVNIDYDGASTTYGPRGKVTLDSLEDAGYPRWWYGLLALHPQARIGDMNDNSYASFNIGTQGQLATQYFGVSLDTNYPDSKGRCPVKGANGYFMSATPHYHGTFRDMYKQSSYTDAATVPFGALSGNLETTGGVSVGDCGFAIRYGAAKNSLFYFADQGATSGPKAEAVGECSYALFLNLGGETKAPGKTPDNNWPVSFLVFPRIEDRRRPAGAGELCALTILADECGWQCPGTAVVDGVCRVGARRHFGLDRAEPI